MNLLAGLDIDVDLAALYQQLGYPDRESVSDAVREVCEVQLPRLERFIEPWGAWREIAIEGVEGGAVQLEGGRALTSGRLAHILGQATALRLVVVTLGDRIGPEVRRLMDEEGMIDAMVFDAAGTVSTHFVIRHLVERVCREALDAGGGTTIRYGPGYTGWALPDIEVLFSYLDPEELPLRLTEQLTMLPEKSVLNVVGLTPGGKRSADLVPCRICDLQNCTVRRVPYGASAGDGEARSA
ncbi:MAG: hypothetical protein JRE70_16795 [Deltaproteobacteria bacterium]|nr:hypothetical protein [Deltaproteobacteria bacterium]